MDFYFPMAQTNRRGFNLVFQSILFASQQLMQEVSLHSYKFLSILYKTSKAQCDFSTRYTRWPPIIQYLQIIHRKCAYSGIPPPRNQLF